ncbi:arginine--tRNA ligase [Flaviflexus salsibiostraticola]|uniref:Arginine--tRNA ligase n=1 Tax=Flaviflexus salsibiostraticola TaxID=1282737 RepID=A0A3Q8WTJ7_9ACTO|nr:arginine--tRNA ligase [Flaviflexus salsibiostraticola]AZN29918.1 arginine--tRNA ligase [Flaviflexus salsibiostraticola]
MTPEELSALIDSVLREAAADGAVALSADELPTVKVERPRNRDHGDWATNVAMQLAKKAGTNPRDLGTLLAERLETREGIDSASVAGPGFINIRLAKGAAGELARTILTAGAEYGRSNAQAGAVNLEFVSANPTGPIHLGGVRWAAVGDSLARLLEATGSTVTREYYFNDAGAQIDRFSESLLARAKGEAVPDNGYGGDYITDVATKVVEDCAAAGEPNPLTLPDAEAQEVFRARGVDIMFSEIKRALADFGVEFDVYYHEDTLHKSGAVTRAVDVLRQRGHVYDSDGAVWIRTSDFGDDKDRVVFKSDGEAAYFAGDVAYYLDKRERGADHVIIMLGADHHGYIGRMYAMARAFGDTAGPGENLELLIGQMVNLVKDGQPVRMSKRAGNIITLEDLVDAVGVDAARYALVRSSVDTTLELDLDLLASRTNENPVFYVQYAHARTCSVARNAAEHGVTRDDFNPAALDHAADSALLGVLAEFPDAVAQAADLREPHRVARYLEELAASYHTWYGQTRVTPRSDEEVTDGHRARLWLNDATTRVLANGLTLLGVSAPEKM